MLQASEFKKKTKKQQLWLFDCLVMVGRRRIFIKKKNNAHTNRTEDIFYTYVDFYLMCGYNVIFVISKFSYTLCFNV